MTRLTIDGATQLIVKTLEAAGLDGRGAGIAAAHLIDCELRGLSYGGLARTLTVAERLEATGRHGVASRVVKETPVSVTLDGGDELGYIVALETTERAIEKARASGIAIGAASNTWYTGMFSWYLEMITAAGFVGMVAGNAGTNVAPYGATEGMLGTNPIGFGFPSATEPVIWDTGTSAITHAEVVLARRMGQELPAGIAFAPDGEPTTDPAAALAGAFAVWGGHRGSGLSLTVHLLGMLTGSPAIPRTPQVGDLGFLVWVVDPDVLTDGEAFRKEVSAHADRIRASRALDPNQPVRVPFDRSRAEREASRARGFIEVENQIVEQLRDFVRTRCVDGALT